MQHGLIILCSGPGAAQAIQSSTNIGLASFALCMTLFWGLLIFRRKTKFKTFITPLLLFVLHPYVWLSARSGDCGYILRYVSIVYAVLAIIIISIIYLRTRRNIS